MRRSPCDFGKTLAETAEQLTVHVIAFRTGHFTWMGEQSALEAKCLADRNKGLYVTVATQEELARLSRNL